MSRNNNKRKFDDAETQTDEFVIQLSKAEYAELMKAISKVENTVTSRFNSVEARLGNIESAGSWDSG